MGTEPYSQPLVEKLSIEELLTQAQTTLDALMGETRKLGALVAVLRSEIEGLDAQVEGVTADVSAAERTLTEAEGLVQKLSVARAIVGEEDADH